MTQLVELQRALPKFEAAGIKLYGVSYDDVEALAEFSRAQGITFPLLSDPGSLIIKEYGILNHYVKAGQTPFYGIPFPGTYLVDENGVIIGTFFDRHVANRRSAESVIDSALGEILLGAEEPSISAGDDDIRVSATYHGGGGSLQGLALRELVVRFELAPGLHIYDEPVPNGMVATQINVEAPEGIRFHELIKPPTHTLTLSDLGIELQVWDGQVDFVLPFYADDRIVSVMTRREIESVTFRLELKYQACDSQVCHIPTSKTLELSIPVAAYIGAGNEGDTPGVEGTDMDTKKFMLKKLKSGFAQHPFRTIWNLFRIFVSKLVMPKLR